MSRRPPYLSFGEQGQDNRVDRRDHVLTSELRPGCLWSASSLSLPDSQRDPTCAMSFSVPMRLARQRDDQIYTLSIMQDVLSWMRDFIQNDRGEHVPMGSSRVENHTTWDGLVTSGLARSTDKIALSPWERG